MDNQTEESAPHQSTNKFGYFQGCCQRWPVSVFLFLTILISGAISMAISSAFPDLKLSINKAFQSFIGHNRQ